MILTTATIIEDKITLLDSFTFQTCASFGHAKSEKCYRIDESWRRVSKIISIINYIAISSDSIF